MAHFETSTFDTVAGNGAAHLAAETLFALGLEAAAGSRDAADLVSAHMWFNLAARAGHEDADRHRRDLAEEMTSAELTRALRRAREWVRLR